MANRATLARQTKFLDEYTQNRCIIGSTSVLGYAILNLNKSPETL